jgi:hypothetical protein
MASLSTVACYSLDEVRISTPWRQKVLQKLSGEYPEICTLSGADQT